MVFILSIFDKDKVNMYLNQEDKEDKEVILEAYQALISKCSNPSFFLKSLINELLTNKKVNKKCNEHTIINDADIDLYLMLGIQNVSSDELFKPRNHLIKLLKDQFKNENDDNTINDRVMSSIMGNMTPFLVDTTSLETKCKLSSLLENHSTIEKHKLDNDKNPNTLIEKFDETPTKLQEYEEMVYLIKEGVEIINFIDIISRINPNPNLVESELNGLTSNLKVLIGNAQESINNIKEIVDNESDKNLLIKNLYPNISKDISALKEIIVDINTNSNIIKLTENHDLINSIINDKIPTFSDKINTEISYIDNSNLINWNDIVLQLDEINESIDCSNHKKFCETYLNDINTNKDEYLDKFNEIVQEYLSSDELIWKYIKEQNYYLLYTLETTTLNEYNDKFEDTPITTYLNTKTSDIESLQAILRDINTSITNEEFQNKYMRAINPSILKPYQIALIVSGSIIVMVIIGFLIKHILKRKKPRPSLENKSSPYNISYKTSNNNKSPMNNKTPNNKTPSNTKPFNNISYKKIL